MNSKQNQGKGQAGRSRTFSSKTADTFIEERNRKNETNKTGVEEQRTNSLNGT